jgi:hypothetical protein
MMHLSRPEGRAMKIIPDARAPADAMVPDLARGARLFLTENRRGHHDVDESIHTDWQWEK